MRKLVFILLVSIALATFIRAFDNADGFYPESFQAVEEVIPITVN